MRLKVTPDKFAVYCALNILFVLILTSSFAGFLNYKMDLRYAAAAALSVNILLYVLYLYHFIDIIIAAAAAVSGAAYYFIAHENAVNTIVSVGNYVNRAYRWFILYMFTDIKIELQYAFLVMMVYAAALSIILFILVVVRHQGLIPMLLGISLISAMWYYGYDNAFGEMQKYLILSFVLLGFLSFERRENAWKLGHDKYSKTLGLSWIIYSCIAAVLSFLIASFMPSGINPVSIQWINENVFGKVANIGPNQQNRQINIDKLKGRFDISYLGFQQSPSKLGGPVQQSNKLLLKAKIDGTDIGPFYLRGTVRSAYNGSSWEKAGGDAKNIRSGEVIDNISGNTGSIKKSINATLTIRPQGLNTTSIFNLWQPYSVDSGGDSISCSTDGEIYFSRYKNPKEYKVVSKVPIVYGDELEKAPHNASTKSLAKYLEVSGTVPQRVTELADVIAGRYTTDYDKAIAIQNYLRSNYPYTLTTSPVPYGRDFVDYFLFDEKKGYCTYFATAMAIMCRLEGIPSRYVEGFILDSPQRDSDGYYSAFSTRAHAWVELYFEGYGWINFEPTPGYTVIDYARPTSSPDTGGGDNTGNNTITPPSGSQNPGGKQLDPDENPGGAGATKRGIPYMLIAGILAAAALILRVGYKMYSSAKLIRRADTLDGKEAAMEYMKLLEKRLQFGGEARKPGETPDEFGERSSKFLQEYGIDIKDLMARFDIVRFGNSPMDKPARRRFRSAIRKTDKAIKDRQGILKYLLIKYII